MDTLDIKITNNCNYCCPYCFAEEGRQDLDRKTFLKSIELAKKIRVKNLEFCGGEPLMNKNFSKFVKIARENDFKLILRTNGILVKKKLKIIAENFSWVGISIDGLAEANGRLRISRNKLSDKSKFEIPLEAIRLLRQKNPTIKIILSTTATRENYDDIPRLGEYLIKNDIPIDMWKINLFMPRRFRAKINKNKYEILAESLDKLEKDINIKSLNQKGIKVFIRKSKLGGGDCLIVSPDGKVSVSSTKIANINENSPMEIAGFVGNNEYLRDIKKNKKNTYV